MATSSGSPASAPRLRRVLTLWDLLLYGIILIQPTAPMPLFGVVHVKAQGHVVTTVLIGMFAMMLTAVSYGRMARAYPSAGSAYTYVGRELNPQLGFLTGWAMVMDYVINPIICTIWCSQAAMNIVMPHPNPRVAYVIWAVFFAALFTGMNLRGIRATARTNALLTAGMSVVIACFFIAAVRYLFNEHGIGGIFSTQPFYDPKTFSWPVVRTGTSLAILTYIGFDGISTLSEEVENPRRNVLLATVLVCAITGVLGGLEVYMGQRVWPDFWTLTTDKMRDTGFVLAAGRAGGIVMFHLVNLTLLVATIGSGSGAQLAAARLLYGMGRDSVIPRRVFGYIHPRTHTPSHNVLLTGVVALAGALLLTYERGAELLNFGAFIGFMGVNVSSLTRYYLRGDRSLRNALSNLLPPLVGFLVCGYLWWGLSAPARVGGAIWLGLGIAYCAWKTGLFRRPLLIPDLPAEE
jgi:putrescine importer